ncbi:hypothetical protein K8I61_17345 [bacterium]|nr:hypothetical protein [bacterium]
MSVESTAGRPAHAVLAAIKGEAAYEDIVPLLEDIELQRLIVVWSKFPVVFTPDESEPPINARSRWEWLWQFSRFDESELERHLACPSSIRVLITRAKATRLIYPDGTVQDNALKLLRSRIAAALTGKLKR